METQQIEPTKRVSTQQGICPNCGTKIWIGWSHVEVMSVEQYQEKMQRDLKKLKEERKHGNQD